MSPSPRKEAGPCTRVSFSKWMKGMSRSMAHPGHFEPSSELTFVSSFQLGQNDVGSLGSPSNAYSLSLSSSDSVPLIRQLRELVHSCLLQHIPNLESYPQNGLSISSFLICSIVKIIC